jgi:L-asparaginase
MTATEPDIVVLATGGTIDKVYTLAGELDVGPPAATTILATLETDLTIDVRSVLAKDSLDLTDADRRSVADRLDEVDGARVIITHGTDTMTDTAEYLLAHAATATDKVVVLTGALRPAVLLDSDAALNLGASLIACQTLPPGVYVCMSGRVLPAGNARKDPSTGRFGHRDAAAD